MRREEMIQEHISYSKVILEVLLLGKFGEVSVQDIYVVTT